MYRFGTCLDKDGNDTTNWNIEEVDKKKIPDFNLLVGGFPCQMCIRDRSATERYGRKLLFRSY